MKKFSMILILAVLAGAMAFGEAPVPSEVPVFTLDEAMETAKINSEDLRIADLDIEKSSLKRKEALDEQDALEGQTLYFGVPLETQLAMKMVKDGFFIAAADMEIVLSQKGKELAEAGIEMAAKSSFYGLEAAKETYNIKIFGFERNQKLYDIAKTRYQIGLGTKQELLNAEAALNQAELEMKNALSDLYYQKLAFQNRLGLPLDGMVDIDYEKGYEPFDKESVKLEEKMALALENRFDVISKREAYKLQTLNYDLTTSLYSIGTYKGKQALYDKEKAYNDTVKAEQNAELKVQKAYVDMVKAYRSIESLDKSLEAMKESFRLSQLSYELGMATLTDVQAAQKALSEMELARLNAVNGYNLASMNFETSYGIGSIDFN